MADKISQLLTDALTRAAADPAGVPLFGTKSDPGLFPPTAAAKPAAKKCLDDGLLKVLRTDGKGRELCAATEKGLQFLLEQVSPKQVLEDFVRVLESRQGQVDELLTTARGMADSLSGLRATVAAVLPQVQSGRIGQLANPERERRGEALHPVAHAPGSPNPSRMPTMTAVAYEASTALADPLDDLAGTVLAHLADWAASAASGQDCPLPELYRSLTLREQPPSIGAFHDCLRQLHAAGQVYLHPWTGPLYALPEPMYAMLVGHNIAYYASCR